MTTIKDAKQAMISMLTGKKQICMRAIKELNADNRRDEADLEKVRLSVYSIFETVLGAMEKKVVTGSNLGKKLSEEDQAKAFYTEYLSSLKNIPANWKDKQDKAEEKGMTEQQVIEEIKLATVNEIQEYFLGLYREN